jgi:hypothetical protein
VRNRATAGGVWERVREFEDPKCKLLRSLLHFGFGHLGILTLIPRNVRRPSEAKIPAF